MLFFFFFNEGWDWMGADSGLYIKFLENTGYITGFVFYLIIHFLFQVINIGYVTGLVFYLIIHFLFQVIN